MPPCMVPYCLRNPLLVARGFHPRILQVFGHTMLDGREGIVMELCEKDLATLLAKMTRGVDLPSGRVRAMAAMCMCGARHSL
jgi:hypothetical protein